MTYSQPAGGSDLQRSVSGEKSKLFNPDKMFGKSPDELCIDELDDKYKNKYQELVDNKGKMENGLLADIQLMDLQVWSNFEDDWLRKLSDENEEESANNRSIEFTDDS